MNETLDRIIKQSGEMWVAVRERHDSPVLVKLDDSAGPVFELRLPKGESHPFWVVTERQMTADEMEDFLQASRLRNGFEWQLGSLYPMSDGTYMQTRGYVFNGRQPYRWLPTIERVRVTVERVD